MHALMTKIEGALKNPWFEAILGLIIMAAGLTEAWDTLFEDVSTGNVGGHHGVILLGLVHTVKAVPAIIGGIILFVHSTDHEH